MAVSKSNDAQGIRDDNVATRTEASAFRLGSLSAPSGSARCVSLSFRDVETIVAARGIEVSYETIRDRSQRNGGATEGFFSSYCVFCGVSLGSW